jgi:hypothetical protein
VGCSTMKYLNIVVALLPSLSIAKLGETRRDQRQEVNPPLVQVGPNPSFNLGLCEGDCDKDSDCNSSDLVCFLRFNGSEDVPGCSGGFNDPSKYDYCVRKSDLNDSLTQDPSRAAGDLPLKFTTDFPLALCEGMSNGVRKVNDQKDKYIDTSSQETVTAILIAKVVWFAFNETKMNQFLVAGVAKMMVAGQTIAFILMAEEGVH